MVLVAHGICPVSLHQFSFTSLLVDFITIVGSDINYLKMCSNYSLQEQWKNRSKWKESTEMKIYLQIWVLIYVVVQLIIMVLFARLNLGFGYMIIGFGIWYIIMIILIVLAPIILSALPTDRSHSQPMPSLRSQEIKMHWSIRTRHLVLHSELRCGPSSRRARSTVPSTYAAQKKLSKQNTTALRQESRFAYSGQK